MFNRICKSLAIVALLALSAPVFARSLSESLDLSKPAKIGDTDLRPGHYKFTANPNSDKLQVLRDGKLVATVDGKIVNLNSKAPYSAVLFNGRRIHEIQFSGKTEAIEIPNS